MTYLPLIPSQSGYSASERDSVVARAELAGGAGRYRLDMLDASSQVSVSWRLRYGQYLQLQAFYRSAAASGAEAFEVDLLLDDGALTRHSAHFVPGTLRLEGIEGGTYVVKADLEVLQADTWSADMDEAVLLLYEEYGIDDGALAVLALLAELVNQELPA